MSKAVVFVRWSKNPQSNGRTGWLVQPNGCHIWTGKKSPSGYGIAKVDRREQRVHRVRYEREIGPVPPGMVLDHFACDNRLYRENILRGNSPSSENLAKEFCKHGHEFWAKRKDGTRYCVPCARNLGRKRRAKIKAAAR